MKSIEELRADYADTYLNRVSADVNYLNDTFASFIFLKYGCMSNNNIQSLKTVNEKLKKVSTMIDAYLTLDLEGGTK
jgi:hypothetical protein